MLDDDDDIYSSFDRIAEKIKGLKKENESLKKDLEQERENNKTEQFRQDHVRLEELGKEMEKIFVMFEAAQSYFSSLGASITEIKKRFADLDLPSIEDQSSLGHSHNKGNVEESKKLSVDQYNSLAEESHKAMVEKELAKTKEVSRASDEEREREELLKKELMGDGEGQKEKDDDFFSVDDAPKEGGDKNASPSGVPKWLDADDGDDPFAENEGMDTDEFMKNFNP